MSVKSGEMSEKVKRPIRQEITKTDKVIVHLITLHVQKKHSQEIEQESETPMQRIMSGSQ